MVRAKDLDKINTLVELHRSLTTTHKRLTGVVPHNVQLRFDTGHNHECVTVYADDRDSLVSVRTALCDSVKNKLATVVAELKSLGVEV